MAIEKKWPAVAPQAFTANGTTLGVVTIANTAGFKVKQTVTIQSTSPANQVSVQVKRVVSPTQLIVGPLAENIQPAFKQQGNSLLSKRQDISVYTIAAGSFIYAQEQDKVTIRPDDIIQSVYRQEPGTTIGVEIDDQFGNPIDSVVTPDGLRRLAVDAILDASGITIGAVDQGDPNTPDNAWPVKVTGDNENTIEPNTDGSINVLEQNKLIKVKFDEQVISYDSNQNVSQIIYKLAGTTVATQVLTYDGNQNVINNKVT